MKRVNFTQFKFHQGTATDLVVQIVLMSESMRLQVRKKLFQSQRKMKHKKSLKGYADDLRNSNPDTA